MKKKKGCRKSSTVLFLGAAVTPLATTTAAPLGTNLTVNPGFENVNLAVRGDYGAPMILDWVGTVSGFAYSHDATEGVPDYANGGPLAGGGHWYFTPGNNGNSSLANALTQDIIVSGGASGLAIATGSATYELSAFFSSYLSQGDRAFIQADFRGPGNISLGTTQISSPASSPLLTWTRFSTSGLVPIGTETIHLSSWGEVLPGVPGSPDGYTDNVSFIIIPEPSAALLATIGLSSTLALRRRRPPS